MRAQFVRPLSRALGQFSVGRIQHRLCPAVTQVRIALSPPRSQRSDSLVAEIGRLMR